MYAYTSIVITCFLVILSFQAQSNLHLIQIKLSNIIIMIVNYQNTSINPISKSCSYVSYFGIDKASQKSRHINEPTIFRVNQMFLGLTRIFITFLQ